MLQGDVGPGLVEGMHRRDGCFHLGKPVRVTYWGTRGHHGKHEAKIGGNVVALPATPLKGLRILEL